MITFSTSKKQLLIVIKRLKVGLKGKSKKALGTICEVTLTDGQAKFAVPGAVFNLPCITKGVAKFTTPLLYFEDIVKKHSDNELTFSITDNYIQLGEIVFKANICFIENDRILRTIDLPLNYTDKDIFDLLTGGYTEEELYFNNVNKQIADALKRIDDDIYKVLKILSKYNVQYTELKQLVFKSYGIDIGQKKNNS